MLRPEKEVKSTEIHMMVSVQCTAQRHYKDQRMDHRIELNTQIAI